ncbi:MAG: hypothetical protein IT406_02000 [Candidatus Yanofskybacteria bacterium]|nr:hypothetical protein [Candidatus Yanofskybacteria bacterium]
MLPYCQFRRCSVDIPAALRAEWAPKLEKLLETAMRKFGMSRDAACDEMELAFLMSSEEAKERCARERAPEEEVRTHELTARMLFFLVAELRDKKGA